MAEGGQMDSLLDCPICLETLTTPVCLPCGHTFCLQCITDHAQTFRGYPINRESFNCPACRKTVAIPDEGIGKLPRNYLAQQMKEKNTSAKIACDECREWNQSEAATFRCVECDYNLCEKCKLVHSRDTSITHHIKEIVTLQTASLYPRCENNETCPMHQGEVLRFFCEPCKVPLCRDCVSDHQGHKIEDIRKVADRARQNITAAMNDKKSDIKNYEAIISELTNKRDTIKNNTEKAIKKTRDHTKLLLDQIKQKSIDTEQQIQNTSDASISTIQTQIDKLLKRVADFQNDFDKCDAVMKSTHYTELVGIGLRITENKQDRQSKFNMGIINKPLKYMEFIGNDTNCLNLHKAFKTLEKEVSPYQVEFENKFGKHVTGYTSTAPPVARKPRVVASFESPPLRSSALASTSGGHVVFPTSDGHLLFYKKDGTMQTKALLNKDRSQFTMIWWGASDIDVADDDSLLIVESAHRVCGGGMYLFNKEGVQTGVIEIDWPYAAAYVADGEVAVLAGSLPGVYLEIWKVTGTSIKTKRIKTDNAVCIAVNKVTHDIIVTHDDHVASYRYPDLSVRWTYRGEGDGKLTGARGVCVDGWGRVMVADCERRRVIVLSPEGEYVTHFNTDYFMKDDRPLRLAVRGKHELVVAGSVSLFPTAKIYKKLSMKEDWSEICVYVLNLSTVVSN